MLSRGTTGPSAEVLGRLEPVLGQAARWVGWAEERHRPADAVFKALAAEGAMRLLVPRVQGGVELDLADFVDVIEAVSAVDGSLGWTVMTCNEVFSLAAAHLPAETVTDLLAATPQVILAGSAVPNGTAVPDGDGWSYDGHWRYVSGVPVADRVLLAALVGETRPRRVLFGVFPADEVKVLDTWNVTGLRGTGSNDVTLRGAAVPRSMVGFLDGGTRPDCPFYRLPVGLRLPWPKVGVASGIARAALDAFTDLAGAKIPTLSRTSLRDRPTAQLALAEGEALWASGRAWVREVLAEVWALAVAGEPVPAPLHARARLACTHSVASSVRAVELVCTAAGMDANASDSPLSRCHRDVHAVPLHVAVAANQATSAARVLLGLDAGDPAF